MNNSISDRLKIFIEAINLSINKFEDEVEVSSGTIAKAIRGGKNIQTDTLRKILLRFPEMNPRWILLGEGEMSWTKEAMNNQKVLGDSSILLKSLTEAGERINSLTKELEDLRYTREIQRKYIEKLEADQKRSKSPVRADNL